MKFRSFQSYNLFSDDYSLDKIIYETPELVAKKPNTIKAYFSNKKNKSNSVSSDLSDELLIFLKSFSDYFNNNVIDKSAVYNGFIHNFTAPIKSFLENKLNYLLCADFSGIDFEGVNYSNFSNVLDAPPKDSCFRFYLAGLKSLIDKSKDIELDKTLKGMFNGFFALAPYFTGDANDSSAAYQKAGELISDEFKLKLASSIYNQLMGDIK